MKNSTVYYPRMQATGDGAGIVSHAGTILLTRTAEVTGLTGALRSSLTPWSSVAAIHDPAKILLDLAVSIAAGGDCLADIATVRDHDQAFGPVASDPTVSRLISRLGSTPEQALAAIRAARASAREHVWTMCGTASPLHNRTAQNPLVVDLDATLVTAHSDKENARPTYKRGYGFHPLMAFIDHGPGGTGEAASALLRPGNAGANTAADHITVTKLALAQVPAIPARPGRRILVRTDSAGGTHEYLEYLDRIRVSYSVGFALSQDIATIVDGLPRQAWTPAYNSDGNVRENADVAELTGVLDLTRWPDGMRVIVRREKPHPGAQLRITDRNGWRLTAFATNTARGQHADLELRHRRRARCEDRIRIAKNTGLENFPLHSFGQNQIWLALVELVTDLVAWTQMLALAGTSARTWEIKRLRLRLLATAARVARHARTQRIRFDTNHRWTPLLVAALNCLNQYRAPD